MLDWLYKIPNLSQNLACGALGAGIVVLYELYKVLPDMKAVVQQETPPRLSTHFTFTITALVILRVGIALILGAFVSALLVRPQETYGALVTGMTWSTVLSTKLKSR